MKKCKKQTKNICTDFSLLHTHCHWHVDTEAWLRYEMRLLLYLSIYHSFVMNGLELLGITKAFWVLNQGKQMIKLRLLSRDHSV